MWRRICWKSQLNFLVPTHLKDYIAVSVTSDSNSTSFGQFPGLIFLSQPTSLVKEPTSSHFDGFQLTNLLRIARIYFLIFIGPAGRYWSLRKSNNLLQINMRGAIAW